MQPASTQTCQSSKQQCGPCIKILKAQGSQLSIRYLSDSPPPLKETSGNGDFTDFRDDVETKNFVFPKDVARSVDNDKDDYFVKEEGEGSKWEEEEGDLTLKSGSDSALHGPYVEPSVRILLKGSIAFTQVAQSKLHEDIWKYTEASEERRERVTEWGESSRRETITNFDEIDLSSDEESESFIVQQEEGPWNEEEDPKKEHKNNLSSNWKERVKDVSFLVTENEETGKVFAGLDDWSPGLVATTVAACTDHYGVTTATGGTDTEITLSTSAEPRLFEGFDNEVPVPPPRKRGSSRSNSRSSSRKRLDSVELREKEKGGSNLQRSHSTESRHSRERYWGRKRLTGEFNGGIALQASVGVRRELNRVCRILTSPGRGEEDEENYKSLVTTEASSAITKNTLNGDQSQQEEGPFSITFITQNNQQHPSHLTHEAQGPVRQSFEPISVPNEVPSTRNCWTNGCARGRTNVGSSSDVTCRSLDEYSNIFCPRQATKDGAGSQVQVIRKSRSLVHISDEDYGKRMTWVKVENGKSCKDDDFGVIHQLPSATTGFCGATRDVDSTNFLPSTSDGRVLGIQSQGAKEKRSRSTSPRILGGCSREGHVSLDRNCFGAQQESVSNSQSRNIIDEGYPRVWDDISIFDHPKGVSEGAEAPSPPVPPRRKHKSSLRKNKRGPNQQFSSDGAEKPSVETSLIQTTGTSSLPSSLIQSLRDVLKQPKGSSLILTQATRSSPTPSPAPETSYIEEETKVLTSIDDSNDVNVLDKVHFPSQCTVDCQELPQSVSALHLAAEGRDYLMWCPDRDFDRAVATLDVRGLVDLVQTLQDAMAVEQQTFDSLTQQLELVSDPLVQQRLSAALCTSQTRLARLCSRNMRCFTQQALKARQKDESRSSSPRDSGLVMSSSGGVSDVERDPRSPTTVSFKNSLAFFQRASNIVPTNTRNAPTESLKESHRRSSRGSSTCTSGSEDLNISGGFIEDLPTGGDFVGSVSYLDRGGEGGGGGGGRGYGEDEYDLEKFEDHGTYEQVLFINGRPQYQGGAIHGDPRDERCGIGEQSDRSSSTRVRIDGSTGRSLVLEEASGVRGGGGGGGGRGSEFVVGLTPAHSVANYSSLPRRAHARARKGVTAVAEDELRRGLLQEQREQPQVNSDLGGYVTLPRRKPYLNFRSVSCGPNPGSAEFDNDDLSYFKEKVGISRSSSAHAITRTQSCKEGLNHSSEFYDSSAYGLSRTQSFHDGLAGDFNAVKSVKPKLQRAPSVDEILESVKSLRAKKNMVKSTPDLVGSQESSPYHSTSLTRHKGKSHRTSGSASSLLGVRYNGSSYGEESNYDQMPEPDYEQIRESSSASSNVTMNPFYENLVRDNYYENVHLKGEVIYDNPRPTEHHYDRVHDDIHYENLDYDDPVYENVHEKEPTYMNVSDSSTLSSTASSSSRKSKSKVYANLEPVTGAQQKGHGSSGSSDKGKGKSRGKVTVTGGSSVVDGLTYDVPRAATHIYDSPQKQIRSVMPAATQAQASEYDTPKSNRSVLPQSTQIVLKTKKEQKQRIDDIFADCDQDSLDGAEMEPDIPSPDYGSEEEPESLDDKPATKDTFTSSDLADEGLGDTDSRSYYTEEQGLEVILEEPEEEDCISAASEDDLRRDVDISHELKGERRSLDGSEGIGSAEGDCHSSGGSEHYVEEDCASSGIHSQDTPSPGPPVEDHPCTKDDLNPRGGVANEEERIQKDRCVEVYPETVRQRQRNNNMSSSNKVDIKNWTSSSNKGDANSPSKVKKFLPSVKALRNQFETGKTNHVTNGSTPSPASTPVPTLSRKSSSSNSSLASSTLEKTSSTNSLASTENGSTENLVNSDIREFVENERTVIMDPDEPVEPIFNQFKSVDEELKELMSKPPSTTGWNPLHLLKRLYFVPEAPKMKSEGTTYINIEGYLEKLPSGRKKATFWNAWKRRYFIAKDGILYYYQNNQAEKPSMKLPLMGGKVECMEPNMVGVDDGKGHYVVVRCSSRQEAERWRRALETHTVEDFSNQYVQPWPVPTNPTLLRDTLVVDLGSCSVRAGVLASNPTLPQLFFPCVVATQRDSRRQTWGLEALDPDVRSSASLSFPIRPSLKITKYSVDLNAVSSLLQKTFADLKVDPKNYNLQLSVPRILNPNTQVELLKILFDKFECRSVNLTHQSILSLYAYNATSGIVVDLGERMDIVPVIDGYIVDGGVSRVPYGGYRILDHLRQFLYMRNVSLVTEVEGYILRYVLENLCYCAQHYNTEKARCTNNPDNFEKSVTLGEFFHGRDCPYETISLDFGRFQSTEGVFNPDAWGLDHPGLHKLVHKAIQECSMDIRKEMSRSIFLVGGASQLPGLAERLTTELDNLTPPAIRPKVHCSPHRYHAAYLGACVLAESNAFQQSKITREEWNKYGNASIRKWSL